MISGNIVETEGCIANYMQPMSNLTVRAGLEKHRIQRFLNSIGTSFGRIYYYSIQPLSAADFDFSIYTTHWQANEGLIPAVSLVKGLQTLSAKSVPGLH